MTQIKSLELVEGHCHCGLIALSLNFLPDSVTLCNCSICRRYNAVWGYYKRHEINLKINYDKANAYRWGDQMIDFISCSNCGCVSHYEDVEKGPDSRLAVNFRMFADHVWQGLNVRYFDGADSFNEINREQFLKCSKDK